MSSPAARLITRSQPAASDRSTRSSISRVRTTVGQWLRAPRGSRAGSASPAPAAPASSAAKGSWKRASGRSDSLARYTATQRAVSETSRMPGVRVPMLSPVLS
ncbi:Uncharacterised protein [Mycobacteroides abscessus subsp. abscessus]|nr:Uncharacterised protein [Mycobacteroides abscessus subsp. abscessus]